MAERSGRGRTAQRGTIDTDVRNLLRFCMRSARAPWAGPLLAMVWMVARLALPLQPTCPHHAPHVSAAVATGTTHVAHQAAGISGEAEGVATASMAPPVEHAQHGISPESSAPASLPGPKAPDCECGAHCCAAPGIELAPSAVSITAVVSYAVASEPREGPRLQPVPRLDVAQPPATAPPTRMI